MPFWLYQAEKASQGDSVEEELPEEEASFTGDSSSSGDDSDEEEEDGGLGSQEAQAMAMEEAKAMLRDRKPEHQQQFFEDEAST